MTREHGLKQAEDILVTHPDIAAIYAANDEVALGAAQAIAVAGKTGKVAITGMNRVPTVCSRRTHLELQHGARDRWHGKIIVHTMVNAIVVLEGAIPEF